MLSIRRIVWFIFTYIKVTKPQNTAISTIDSIQVYCTSFTSCWDCKRAGTRCDWCHEVGCTHYPSRHCPQKVFLDNAFHKNSPKRQCTEIVSPDPVFFPANVRGFVELNMKVDDLTLYDRDVMCEIHIENSVLRLKAIVGDNTVQCDLTTLKISQAVVLGYIRLLWGGAEPYSNMILMVVYKCETMANDCMECQDLDKRFKCGWCDETLKCSLKEQCPGVLGIWAQRKSVCVW